MIQNYQKLIANGATQELQQKRKDALDIITAALDAVNPYNAVSTCISENKLVLGTKTLDLTSFEHLYVIGFGKASVGMATAACDNLAVKQGIVITNDPQATSSHETLTIMTGGHPLPTQGSITGAQHILELLGQTTQNDLVLVVISGGGSALFCHPRVSLEEMQETTHQLLKSGADINEINTIRKHLSQVKGGQLVTSTPATVVSLIISDIVNDPIDFIASGPTAPDTTTYQDAETILKKYHIWDSIPAAIHTTITKGIQGELPETPKPHDPIFKRVHNSIIASNALACQQAITKAEHLGYTPHLYTTQLTGEARELGPHLVNQAQQLHENNNITAMISGGEPTVTIKGSGKGGRNQELVLSSIKHLEKQPVVLVSFGTDGIDGTSPAAGALADEYTLQRATKQGLDIDHYLENNDSSTFFTHLQDTILTGPTGTNVMDIQLLLM